MDGQHDLLIEVPPRFTFLNRFEKGDYIKEAEAEHIATVAHLVLQQQSPG